MGYLADQWESGGSRVLVLLCHRDGRLAMIVPSLSENQARHTGIEDIRAYDDGEDAGTVFENLANEWNLKTGVFAVDDELPAFALLKMQKALPAGLFKSGGELLASIRKRKEPQEIENMRTAGRIADKALHDSLPNICVGMNERQVAQLIVNSMSEQGGEPEFCIVARGPNGAEPHHVTSNDNLKAGDIVVIDWGCLINHYHSDITRCICLGKATEEVQKVYQVVWQAHMAARSAIKPGVPCQEIDRAARKVITDAGYGEYFVHRTGHGIGLQGHEPPHMVEGSETLLEEGQCFSVEPGIYLPGKFGIRIENLVTVTSNGHETFNEEPPERIIEIGDAD